jgi:hypothetical protein
MESIRSALAMGQPVTTNLQQQTDQAPETVLSQSAVPPAVTQDVTDIIPGIKTAPQEAGTLPEGTPLPGIPTPSATTTSPTPSQEELYQRAVGEGFQGDITDWQKSVTSQTTAIQKEPVEATLAKEEEAPVEILEEPVGTMAAISSFLDNPQVQMAMFQAAKALDPKGFGGQLAVGMEPILKGQDYQKYVSDLLSGKAPDEITSGTILSPKEKESAIKQYQGQQLVDKAESPLQKLYRDIAKTATAGEYNMAVAKTKIAIDMAKAINATNNDKNKKEVTESYKAISDIRGKISMDIIDKEGNFDNDAYRTAILGGQPLMTAGDKEALKAAVEFLEGKGYNTIGMRQLLDATDNLTQPATINPLAPPPTPAAVEGPESIEAGVSSGALTDHGDGTYTVNVPGHALNGQKVKVGKNGDLRTL